MIAAYSGTATGECSCNIILLKESIALYFGGILMFNILALMGILALKVTALFLHGLNILP